ncbi:uncharacterized protein LOC134244679 [Saccostrea cucullata]|uniref:uncharacterized protein LOC134244679 n=1 Tax=Saccostrea cuccullata TaxID=36930 RepID=UPI002ED69D96
MAASPYSSTEEPTNACRACRLLLGPCTDQFRDVFRHFVPPSSFQHVILRKTSDLPRLTAPQMNLILPRGSSYTGNYSDMDISLLYILLRNICSIPPHSTGWGNAPDPADRSLSASIERIHTARNQCVISSSSVLSDADFNRIWSTVRSAVVDLDSFLNNGNLFKSQVDVIKQETMDPVGDQHFIEELKKQIEEDAPTKEIVHDLQKKIEKSDADRVEKQNEMQRILDEIKTPKSVIPPNVKDNHEKQIQQWVEEDKVFSKTHNFEEMLDKVRERPYLTFVGIPGSGKSATIQHISLILQKEGYEIVPIIDIRKIEDYCDSLKPQVFVIDDVVGVLGLQKQKLNLLMEYEIQISNPSNKDTKVLMSCRETVFNECHSYKSFLTHEKTAVMLHSSENSLTVDDKKRILLKHGLDDKLLPDSLLRDSSGMFPLLCKLYSKEEKFRNNAERFFTCPVECILEELDKMQHQNKLYYATLVLCMFNDKKLSKEILKNTENTAFHDMKSDVLENCEVESYTDAYKFDNALKAMEGTYMHLRGNEYNFIHDSIFEIIAYHFGSQYPNLILQYISSSYVANKVKIQKCKKYEIGFGNKQAFENKSTARESKPEEENGSVSSEISNDKAFNDLCIRLKEK